MIDIGRIYSKYHSTTANDKKKDQTLTIKDICFFKYKIYVWIHWFAGIQLQIV